MISFQETASNLTSCLKYSTGLFHTWVWQYSRLKANSADLQVKGKIYADVRRT